MLADSGTAAGRPNPPASCAGRQPPRQLQQRERVPARLGNDPLEHVLVQAGRQDRLQQRPRVTTTQGLDVKLGQARRARRPAPASRTRARSSPPTAAAPRTRAPAQRRGRATARRRRGTAAAAPRPPPTAGRGPPARPGTGSAAGPALRPNATPSASRWGSGRRSTSSRIGEHSCWSAANGSSISPSTPTVRGDAKVRRASSTAYSSSAVLPTPGSPWTTSTPPRPPRAASSSRSSDLALALAPEQAVVRQPDR